MRKNNEMKIKIKICKIDNCKVEHYCKGYCKIHYTRFSKWGNPLYIDPSKDRPFNCIIEYCDKKHEGFGYCQKHLRRLKKYGDPLKTMKNMNHSNQCSINHCNNKFYGNNQCKYHYDINRLHIMGKIFKITKHNYNMAIRSWSKLIRQNNKCQICGISDNLEAHHIFHKIKYPELSLNENNGLSLCKKCHLEAHGRGIYFEAK